jgi:hypothetical protein
MKTPQAIWDAQVDRHTADGHVDVEAFNREAAMTPEQEPLLQFFHFAHLPPELGAISQKFHALAHDMVAILPRNPERTVAIRKLLEAKDCAVRARLWNDDASFW